MRIRLFLAALIATLPVAAEAQGVIVANTSSCGTYLQDRQEGSPYQIQLDAGEVRAYISGFNMATSGKPTQSIPEADSVLAYMDKYCRDHPLDNTILGMGALIKDLGGTRK